ncbi:MurR/RpiR family transcriptional regulator [Enterococcus sp. FSL R5-0957]|uniref:MurR/RpiR family transcriptional regulator n=1 Tax=Enterococcus sp. FSL R5-0957 TaxID=2921725 RepID=UPI001142A318|nr:MurR/RpiR family transcriptional regulator [Enterococcus faecium]NTR84997.1 MurR/RpiR family transcriptional regulator [Enterococcus faecium]NTS03342.1 MurR/RpiR family transcriptional regulator [Enterococcus faecium]TQA59481.1 MurR/RpiR family transcriptional regulator [Enterococcus faecium]TQA63893.1 MurR/RpiR family transcriptional regulator [Enterococcus faecium]TQA84709.1 MurR/RpiR family transcriptional regulator [Enterococcus faecium]
MSVIKNIENVQGELSITEKKLAKYILANFTDIPQMTVQKLADLSATSAATVTRFSKKIGYKKYSDFKLAISRSIEKQVRNEYSSMSFNESFEVTKKKLIMNDKLIIDSMDELLDETTISEIVEKLYSADKIYVFGVGTSGIAAEDIRQKWLKLGKTVLFEKDKSLVWQQLSREGGEKNVFWGISHSGKNKEVLALVKEANNNQMVTIGMTQIGKSNLEKAVTYVVQTSRTDNIDNGHYGSGATHSLLLQLLTIDIIYFFYLKYSEKHFLVKSSQTK